MIPEGRKETQHKLQGFLRKRGFFFLPAYLKKFSYFSYILLTLNSHGNTKIKQIHKILELEKIFAIL